MEGVTGVQAPFPQLLPESSWRLPREFPDLVGRNARWVGVDCETRDPDLNSRGPGFARKTAYVAGVAVRADGFSGYFPVRHAQGQNLAPNVVFQWLAEQLAGDQPKVGANLLYDLEGLWYEGVRDVRGKFLDVQVAEPLIDEDSATGYSLEALSRKYLGQGKNEALLRDASSQFSRSKKGGKGRAPLDPKQDLWALPPEFVGPYAEDDVRLAEEIVQKQLDQISREDLGRVFDLESSLIPILLRMRIRGVGVDLEYAHKLAAELTAEIHKIGRQLRDILGQDVNVDSGQDLEWAYGKLGIEHQTTDLGNPSFVRDWLEQQDDQLSPLVARKRKLMTLRDDFVLGDIIGEQVDGRIHAQFHQLRGDDRGTRTGRFSSSHPNLQQVPARDDEWAHKVRKCFVPDEGMLWFKGDYSQQEPRLLLHFAYLCRMPGAAEAVEVFRKNPRTDYHQFCTDLCNEKTGRSYERKQIKAINLGIMYTMGLEKLCRMLGIPESEGAEILGEYHSSVAFVRALSSKVMRVVQERGSIRTILGRKCRFDMWEPVPEKGGERVRGYRGLPKAEAEERWPGRRLQRANSHKGLNRLIQGSAGDQAKEAMRQLWRDHNYLSQIVVHDEVDGSVADRRQAGVVKQVMESCVPLEIPVVCDAATGPSWGEAKEAL